MKTSVLAVCLLLLLVALNIQTCRLNRLKSNHKEPVTDTVRKVRFEKYDSLIYVEIDKPVPFEVIEYIDRYPDIDSMAVFSAFYTKIIYARVLLDDSTAFIKLVDTIFMNQLHHGHLVFQNRRPVEIHETYYVSAAREARTQLYAGLTAGGNKNQFLFGPTALIRTRGEHIYGASFYPGNGYFLAHAYFKISLHK